MPTPVRCSASTASTFTVSRDRVASGWRGGPDGERAADGELSGHRLKRRMPLRVIVPVGQRRPHVLPEWQRILIEVDISSAMAIGLLRPRANRRTTVLRAGAQDTVQEPGG